MIVYSVEGGWARYKQCGDNIQEYKQDDYCEWFNTLVDAKETFNAWVADLPGIYRTEKQTAGRCWLEKRPYVELSVYTEDPEFPEYPDYVETLNSVVYQPKED